MPSAFVWNGTAADFDEKVVERSRELPVLVDFWAAWCGPCRMLGPELEKVVAAKAGAVELVKIDTDAEPDLARRHGVNGIPDVRLFRDGREVDKFVGARGAAEIEAFLKPWCRTEVDEHLDRAEAAFRAGDLEAAEGSWLAALDLQPSAPAALLGLARVAMNQGRFDEAAERIAAIESQAPEATTGRELLKTIELAREAASIGDPDSLRHRFETDPKDPEALYALGGHAVGAGRFEEALERFVESIRADLHWKGDAARKAMLLVFGIVGPRSELAERYRARLSSLYY